MVYRYNKGMNSNCNNCSDSCRKYTCCGCPDSIVGIEPADSTAPTKLRFNLTGRSVIYDFDSLIKSGETKTSLGANTIDRQLEYHSEKGDNIISAKNLGNILHLSDIGDVDASSIKDNAILVYQKNSDCAENCEGHNGWIGLDPTEVGANSVDYIIGTDEKGKAISIMPPVNGNQYYNLTWAAQNKASWTQPKEVSTPPLDSDGYAYRLYLDPTTKEIVVHKVKE